MGMARILGGCLVLVASLVVTTANATLVVVSDASATASNSVIFDRSTGGDTAAGVTASFSTGELRFPGATAGAWDGNRSFLDPFFGSIATASWTFSGLSNGSTFDIFASWVADPNRSNLVPYTINGGGTIIKNQEVSPNADLTLPDAADDNVIFELLGQGTVSGGQLVIEVGEPPPFALGNDFVMLDAIAISAVPEPSAFLFGGLICGALGVNYARKRNQMKKQRAAVNG